VIVNEVTSISSHCGCCGHTLGYSGTVYYGICCHLVIPKVSTLLHLEKSHDCPALPTVLVALQLNIS